MAGGTGCVVVRDDGKNIHWKKKCDGCGFVESGTHISVRPSSGSMLTAGYFSCFKCQHQSEVCIYG